MSYLVAAAASRRSLAALGWPYENAVKVENAIEIDDAARVTAMLAVGKHLRRCSRTVCNQSQRWSPIKRRSNLWPLPAAFIASMVKISVSGQSAGIEFAHRT